MDKDSESKKDKRDVREKERKIEKILLEKWTTIEETMIMIPFDSKFSNMNNT